MLNWLFDEATSGDEAGYIFVPSIAYDGNRFGVIAKTEVKKTTDIEMTKPIAIIKNQLLFFK
jgi:hypothetical protein